MFASPGSVPSPVLSDSVVASQLRQGVRGLRFGELELEQHFRCNHRQHARGSVRANVWLAMALMIIFLIIDQQVLQRNQTLSLIAIRLVALSSLLVCAWVLSSKRSIGQHYHRFVQWLAPLFGLCVVINEFIDQPFGVSFFPTIVLTVVGLYLLVGMLFMPALCAGLFVLAAYAFCAWQVALPLPEFIYNITVLVFANVVGATASYLLERLHRTHFLEARLLADRVNRDGLTGIHNRRAFDEHLQAAWQQALRDETPLALMLIDIDHFKAYNDYYGHQAGDECLKQVANLLARVSRRPLDFTARYGGEEFAVVLYNAHRDYVEELASAIRTALRQLALSHAASLVASQLTVSIGAACVTPAANRSSAGLVQLADEALYQAKDKGRDCCVIKDKEYGGLITGSYRNDEDEFVRLVS